jgi:branched-chain amino acid transport system permease protein
MPRNSLGVLVTVSAALAVLGYTRFAAGDYSASVIMLICVNALAAASLRFVMLVGELNIATAAFYGMGAYVSAIATAWYGLPLPIALIAAGLAGALASILFGYVTLRTKGAYFLLVSFAFAEVVRLVFTRIEAIGGNSGMTGIFPAESLAPWYPTITVVVAMALLAGLYRLERSTLGTVFRAIQNNDSVVQSVGLNVLVVKILCLAIASFVAGVGGALHAHANNVISPGDFSFLVAVFALAYIKIGGEGHLLGAILGTVFLTVLGGYLIGLGAQEAIFFGGALVLAMLILPDGLYGIAERLTRPLLRTLDRTPPEDSVKRSTAA